MLGGKIINVHGYPGRHEFKRVRRRVGVSKQEPIVDLKETYIYWLTFVAAAWLI